MKKAIICKQVGDNYALDTSIINTHQPKAGDVAIFEVQDLGKHTRLQCVEGRNRHIYPEDKIMAVFGTRYATNQLEGYVPQGPRVEYHVLGQGGVIGEMKSIHTKYEEKGPTTLKLIGYATDSNGKVINTKYLLQKEVPFENQKPFGSKIILSIGGSMDSGKTTTAAFLCRGLSKANKKVVFAKLTGTVYTKDTDFVLDCGAKVTMDFSSFGFPSTYMCSKQEILNLYQNILHHLGREQPEYIVIEIADGLLQRETSFLLNDRQFMNTIDAVIYSDGNSTGALSGITMLQQIGVRPFALSGLFTAAPLLIEEVKKYTSIPILNLDALSARSILGYVEKANTEGVPSAAESHLGKPRNNELKSSTVAI